MKKLMIGLVGALAMVASAEVESGNIVGWQSKTVAATSGQNRAMRSAATFLKIGDNPTAIKISDIKQTVGDPGDLTICLYDDNVTRLSQYAYVSEEVATEEGIDAGWYMLNSDAEIDVDAGVKDADLPLGQGCVIVSGNPEAEYVSAGEVDSVMREFTIPANARKMMGNFLPRSIQLSELKQIVGDPADHIFCTYDNNVTRTAQYAYVGDEVAEEEGIDAGWYILDSESAIDVEAGTKEISIPSGQGFVVNSGNDDAVLQFPKAF